MTTSLVLAKENRIMINEIKQDIKDIKDDMKGAFNHMSDRLPIWATTLITVLVALLSGLMVMVVKS